MFNFQTMRINSRPVNGWVNFSRALYVSCE